MTKKTSKFLGQSHLLLGGRGAPSQKKMCISSGPINLECFLVNFQNCDFEKGHIFCWGVRLKSDPVCKKCSFRHADRSGKRWAFFHFCQFLKFQSKGGPLDFKNSFQIGLKKLLYNLVRPYYKLVIVFMFLKPEPRAYWSWGQLVLYLNFDQWVQPQLN